MPRVSVVIPTYNRGELLLEAVRSALAQTFTDLEVIVADDGSTDGSLKPLESLGDRRVRVVELEHTGLLGAVRNAGMQRAQGGLVAFLDSDDVWYPEKLEHQISILDGDPEVGLVCSNAQVIDYNGAQIRNLYLQSEEGASGDVLAKLLDANFVIISAAVTRRELVERVGGFTEDARLRGVEDYDLWLRLAATTQVSYLSEPLLAYREHSGNMRVGVSRTTFWISIMEALDNLDAFLGPMDRRGHLVRRGRARSLVDLARAQVVERHPLPAARSLSKAVRIDPTVAVAQIMSGRTLSKTRDAVRGALRGSAVA